ncbi:MAG: signal peptidase I [Oscillospiraceae bacterium]
MDGLKKALHVAVNVLLWILIIIIAFFAIVTFSQKGNGQVASVFGFTPMTVLSDSMAPTFHKDDLIIIRKGDAASYQEGDIISFWTVINNQRSINTHRIASVYREGDMVQYTTRGDANVSNDSYLVATPDVIGKFVVSIPFVGKILSLLSSSIGFLVVVVLPLLAFFIYQLYRFIMLLVDIKRQTVMDATQAAMSQGDVTKTAAFDAAVAAAVAAKEAEKGGSVPPPVPEDLPPEADAPDAPDGQD